MTEQLNGTPENFQSNGRQPSIAVDRRLLQSAQKSSDDLENDYQFFRTLVKNNIFQLTKVSGTGTVQFKHFHRSVMILLYYTFVFAWRRLSRFAADQRAISTWLRRCDEERDQSLKCGIIKLMLVSLQHPGGNMKLFRHSAPKNLPYLVNTPNYVSIHTKYTYTFV